MSRVGVTIDGHSYDVDVQMDQRKGAEMTVTVNGQVLTVVVPDVDLPPHKMEWMIIGRRPYEIVLDRDLHWIKGPEGLHRLDVRDLDAAVARPVSGDGRIKAPIPGLITRVLVHPGSPVAAGEPLLVLEAMKMENEVRATRGGTIAALHVKTGQDVTLDQLLVEIV